MYLLVPARIGPTWPALLIYPRLSPLLSVLTCIGPAWPDWFICPRFKFLALHNLLLCNLLCYMFYMFTTLSTSNYYICHHFMISTAYYIWISHGGYLCFDFDYSGLIIRFFLYEKVFYFKPPIIIIFLVAWFNDLPFGLCPSYGCTRGSRPCKRARAEDAWVEEMCSFHASPLDGSHILITLCLAWTHIKVIFKFLPIPLPPGGTLLLRYTRLYAPPMSGDTRP